MKRLLYVIIQCSWGIIQTLLGLFVFLFYFKNKHYRYKGSIATEWQRYDGLSLGLFIFIPANISINKKEYIYRHEYGHTIQSLILGPFYLLVIGLPSLLWNKLPRYNKIRNNTNRSYYDFYTEKSANYFGKNDDRYI